MKQDTEMEKGTKVCGKRLVSDGKCQFGIFMLFLTSEKGIFKAEHTETKPVIDYHSSVIELLSYSASGHPKTTLLRQEDFGMDSDATEDISSITCMIWTSLRYTRLTETPRFSQIYWLLL